MAPSPTGSILFKIPSRTRRSTSHELPAEFCVLGFRTPTLSAHILLWRMVILLAGSVSAAEAGFIGFCPMLPTDTTIEENLQDARAALDYAKGLPGADPSRLAVMGFSRGGLLALWVATERRDLKAVVLMAPAP